jgi:ribosomal protein L4
MATAKSYSVEGKETGTVELPAALFEQQVNEHLLYQAVRRS